MTRISHVFYETKDRKYKLALPANQTINIFLSDSRRERHMVEVALEMGLLGHSDDPLASLIHSSSVRLDDGDKSGQISELANNQQRFVETVLGRNPLDLVAYFQYRAYAESVNGYLSRVSGARLGSIQWDNQKGMVVVHNTGQIRSVFALTQGEVEVVKLSGALSHVEQKRFPFQVISSESLDLLDQEHKFRFFNELLSAAQPGSQVVVLCTKMDVACSPLATFHTGPVIDLDAEENIHPINEEA